MSWLRDVAGPELERRAAFMREGWIEWRGGECPVALDAMVQVMLRGPINTEAPYTAPAERAGTWFWGWSGEGMGGEIVAYRVVKTAPVAMSAAPKDLVSTERVATEPMARYTTLGVEIGDPENDPPAREASDWGVVDIKATPATAAEAAVGFSPAALLVEEFKAQPAGVDHRAEFLGKHLCEPVGQADAGPAAVSFDKSLVRGLKVAGIHIRDDGHGRYSLNDLHTAAGAIAKDKPANFLRLDSTKALVAEIDQFSDVSTAVSVVNGGRCPGTYVVKELVYAYAMWISAKFNLMVIRAFDDLVNGRIPDVTPAPAFRIPQTLPEALRLAADESERADVAEAEVGRLQGIVVEQAPAVELANRLSGAKGGCVPREAAKLVDVKLNVLVDFLVKHKWLFRQGRRLNPTASATRAGLSGIRPHRMRTSCACERIIYPFRIRRLMEWP